MPSNLPEAAFERLKILARKGYEIAFVWPDRSDRETAITECDEIRLSSEARSAIKKFTCGRFTDGVP
jgi:hypothetical protein